MYLPVSSPLLWSSFVYITLSYHSVSFHFDLQDSLSYEADPVVILSLSYPLSWNVFIPSSPLKDNFSRKRILCWQFYLPIYFSILIILVYDLLVSQLCDKKSIDDCIEDILYVIASLVSFKILSFFPLVFKSEYNEGFLGGSVS